RTGTEQRGRVGPVLLGGPVGQREERRYGRRVTAGVAADLGEVGVRAGESGVHGVLQIHQNPSLRRFFASVCQFLAILTCRSRYTGVPSRASICFRAAAPTSRRRAPLWPITMPFWLSRSRKM